MSRRMRSGWFARALRKWASRRLYRYKFTDAKILYPAFSVTKERNGAGEMIRDGLPDPDVEQVAFRVLRFGFVDGFILARRMAREHHDKFRCYTDKVTKLL